VREGQDSWKAQRNRKRTQYIRKPYVAPAPATLMGEKAEASTLREARQPSWHTNRLRCRTNPHILQTLSTMQEFGGTVTSPVLRANFREERHSFVPHMLKMCGKVPSWQRAY
jgi:hypothetical protein